MHVVRDVGYISTNFRTSLLLKTPIQNTSTYIMQINYWANWVARLGSPATRTHTLARTRTHTHTHTHTYSLSPLLMW